MTLFIAFAAACSDAAEEVVPNAEYTGDSVEIVFEVPSSMMYYGMSTRAVEDEPKESGTSDATDATVSTPKRDIETDRYFPSKSTYETWGSSMLPVGSTVWLSYQKLKSDGTLDTEVCKPYIVRGLRDEIFTLYACGETEYYDEQGRKWHKVNTEESSTPLYLPEGEYYFSVFSPALDITEKDGYYCTKVENGVYFCASDVRYDNSRNQRFTVVAQTNGVQRITLNPMVWQVARLNFEITNGPKVSDLGVSSAGIEVSGLQNPLDTQGNNTYFNWRSSNLADTIPMRMGDKRSWVTIRGEDCTITEGTAEKQTEDGQTITYPTTTITGDVGVLPTNGLSTVFVFLFNLTVNGIPTQYEVTVNKQILYHGRQYPVKITVDGTDDVTVMTWSNQSWTADAVLSVKRKTDF
jgi:hypothetical protein